MGDVYEAERDTGERVALKVLHAKLLDEPKALHRFQREARVSARIENAGVARTFDAGIDRGLPWIAMEFVAGETLDVFIQREAPLSREVARALSRQLLSAIAAAHSAGVVHRDLKPENVLVESTDGGPRLKVGDFGVAKSMDAATFDSTQAGLGTPMWTAPEQGREGWVPSPRADVWALGLLVYYLWTGRPYWKHTGPRSSLVDLSLEIVRQDLVPASERARDQGVAALLPAGFDAWLSRAVVRDPDARYADAGEAARAFELMLAPKSWRAKLLAAVVLLTIAVTAAVALSR